MPVLSKSPPSHICEVGSVSEQCTTTLLIWACSEQDSESTGTSTSATPRHRNRNINGQRSHRYLIPIRFPRGTANARGSKSVSSKPNGVPRSDVATGTPRPATTNTYQRWAKMDGREGSSEAGCVVIRHHPSPKRRRTRSVAVPREAPGRDLNSGGARLICPPECFRDDRRARSLSLSDHGGGKAQSAT